jgi:hypothetical protein
MRRGDFDLPHADVQTPQRIREVGWRDVRRRWRVVGPERNRETVALVDVRRHPRVESSCGALGLGKPAGKLDLELGYVLRRGRDPGEGVAGQESHRELVRVLENDRIIDCQAKR